jgi:Amt family ammonium transporter
MNMSSEPTIDNITLSAADTDLVIAAMNSQWAMLSGVVVFFMQTGFALLESGSVRHKNYQNILIKNCLDFCIGGIVWWAWGYAIYNIPIDGFEGANNFFGVKMEGKYGKWFLSYVFASTSATIVSGSLAERVRMKNYLVFSFLMTGFIYPTVAAWVWG